MASCDHVLPDLENTKLVLLLLLLASLAGDPISA